MEHLGRFLCSWEAYGARQLLEEIRALGASREGIAQPVEKVPLMLGQLRCCCRTLRLLAGWGGAFPIPGCGAPGMVDALRCLQLLLVLGEEASSVSSACWASLRASLAA